MSFDLKGKYWRVTDLEQKFGVSRDKLLAVIRDFDGVFMVGHSYLVPDRLLKTIKMKLKPKKKGLTLASAAQKLRISAQVLKKIVDEGYPTINQDGLVKISYDNIEALQKEVDAIRERDGKVGVDDAAQICKAALHRINL